jgi:hypothetical protein
MLPLDDSSRVSSTRPRCHHKLLERGCQQGPALFPECEPGAALEGSSTRTLGAAFRARMKALI